MPLVQILYLTLDLAAGTTGFVRHEAPNNVMHLSESLFQVLSLLYIQDPCQDIVGGTWMIVIPDIFPFRTHVKYCRFEKELFQCVWSEEIAWTSVLREGKSLYRPRDVSGDQRRRLVLFNESPLLLEPFPWGIAGNNFLIVYVGFIEDEHWWRRVPGVGRVNAFDVLPEVKFSVSDRFVPDNGVDVGTVRGFPLDFDRDSFSFYPPQ